MITIKDVAKKAGVSIAAVSYALNDKGGVTEETKKKIKLAAEELGYVPNSLAQGLLSKKTNFIGLIVPDIANVYTANFIKYLNQYAYKSNFFLLLGSTSGDIDEEKKIVDKFIGRNVDALIILPHNYRNEGFYRDLIRSATKKRVPCLFANMSFPGIKTNSVVPDFEEGQYKITRYLLKSGLKDFTFIGGPRTHYYSEIKYQGFLRALHESNITYSDDTYIGCGTNYTFEDGYQMIREYLPDNALPEAFVVVNDLMALGLIKGLNECGVSVPEDVSVTGFDDIELPTMKSTNLTTVRVPLEDMARLCIEVLKEGKAGNVIKQFVLQPELVIGDSVLSK
jgi:LacI family transcriptional regulator, galactose operon repressor